MGDRQEASITEHSVVCVSFVVCLFDRAHAVCATSARAGMLALNLLEDDLELLVACFSAWELGLQACDIYQFYMVLDIRPRAHTC